jgi:hypothetical protein
MINGEAKGFNYQAFLYTQLDPYASYLNMLREEQNTVRYIQGSTTKHFYNYIQLDP